MARPCITQPQKCPSCLWAAKASRELFAFKMCSQRQRHIKQRAQPSRAPPTARPSKCTLSSVTRAWSGMTTLKPRQRSAHVLEHAQTHHGIPLHTKDARNSTSDSARNSRARHPARPSKCTISSTVRARSGTPTPTTTETLHMRASNTLKGIVGFLCTQKVLATAAAPARQRAQLSGARHRPLAHPNALSRALHGNTRARSGAPTHTTAQKRHARVLSTRRDASRDPFALKRCVLETCGTSKLLAERPTSRPSKSIIWSVTRVMSGASTQTPTDSLRILILWPRPNASLDPFALKTCSQHTAPPRARASLERARNLSLTKMHHIERCTGPDS